MWNEFDLLYLSNGYREHTGVYDVSNSTFKLDQAYKDHEGVYDKLDIVQSCNQLKTRNNVYSFIEKSGDYFCRFKDNDFFVCENYRNELDDKFEYIICRFWNDTLMDIDHKMLFWN